MTSLTIQLVGWNSARALEPAMRALAAVPESEAVIRYLDNGSTDDSVAVVRRMVPQAEVIELGHNTGFAAAHNEGWRRTTTPYVLIHNPDLVIRWEGIKKLLHAFADPTVGAVQGKLMREGNIIDSAGVVLTRDLNGVDRGAGANDGGQFEEPADVLAATGAAALYRVAAIRAVGYFDEDFFSYKEDVDLGWRLQRAGWRSVYRPVVAGYHQRQLRSWAVGSWYRRLKDRRTRYSLRNWVWMILKNVTVKQELKAEPFVAARLLAWLGLSLLYPPLLTVWLEILQGVPRMLAKRRQP